MLSKRSEGVFLFPQCKFWLLPSDPQEEKQKISRSHCCWQWAFLELHFSFPLLMANFKGLTFEIFRVKRSCRSGGRAEPETVQRALLLVGSSSKDESQVQNGLVPTVGLLLPSVPLLNLCLPECLRLGLCLPGCLQLGLCLPGCLD